MELISAFRHHTELIVHRRATKGSTHAVFGRWENLRLSAGPSNGALLLQGLTTLQIEQFPIFVKSMAAMYNATTPYFRNIILHLNVTVDNESLTSLKSIFNRNPNSRLHLDQKYLECIQVGSLNRSIMKIICSSAHLTNAIVHISRK